MTLLAEIPWWLVAAIALLGAVLLWNGLHRGDRRLRNAGLGALAAGVILGALGWFLESDREIVMRRTREIVSAIERRDRAQLSERLHPEVSVFFVKGRDALTNLAISAADRGRLQRARVAGIEADPDDEGGYVVHLRVAATFDSPQISDWRLEWIRTGEQWQLVRAESLGGLGFDSVTLENMLGRWRGGGND